MRTTIERTFLKAVRFYTFNTPISKGKYRLYQTALKMCLHKPSQLEAKTQDGRRYSIDLTSGMHETVYFIGEYEPAITELISAIVKKDDICLDIGANFGWFTVFFHLLTKNNNKDKQNQPSVHAFEPNPKVFNELKTNWQLAGEPSNIYLNNVAMGDEIKAVNLHQFDDMPNGYSSLSDMGSEKFQTVSVPMITLNSYLADHKIENVNFIKLDIEGAELMFLRGATKLFEQKTLPFFIIEMALGTTQGFGYLPNDLIEFIRSQADYTFYKLDDSNGNLTEINGFAPEDIGADVLCVPPNCEPSRLEKLNIVK